MRAYVAPEIADLTPTEGQREIVEAAVQAIRDTDPAFWRQGRGAGKSTVKGLIAQAILDDGDIYPLYTVIPVVRHA